MRVFVYMNTAENLSAVEGVLRKITETSTLPIHIFGFVGFSEETQYTIMSSRPDVLLVEAGDCHRRADKFLGRQRREHRLIPLIVIHVPHGQTDNFASTAFGQLRLDDLRDCGQDVLQRVKDMLVRAARYPR